MLGLNMEIYFSRAEVNLAKYVASRVCTSLRKTGFDYPHHSLYGRWGGNNLYNMTVLYIPRRPPYVKTEYPVMKYT